VHQPSHRLPEWCCHLWHNLSQHQAAPINQHQHQLIITIQNTVQYDSLNIIRLTLCWYRNCIYYYFFDALRSTKVKVNGVQQIVTSLTTTGTYMPCWITVLPANRQRWHSCLTPAEAGTQFSDPGGMQCWVDLVGWLHTEMVRLPEDDHPSHRVTCSWAEQH